MGKKDKGKKNSSTPAAKKQGGSPPLQKHDKPLPEARVRVGQVDALVALMRGLDRRLRGIERRLNEPREPVPAPAPPSPHDATFAAIPEFMAEMRTRLCRIECRQEQPERDPRLDVPARVTSLQRFFAGACKTLGITQPTPAMIGRVMHDNAIFTPNDDKAPRRLLQLIYAKQNVPDHLSPEIRSLLEQYENRENESDAESTTTASGSSPQRSGESPGRSSSRVAQGIGREFDRRFDLIVNTGCGRKDAVQSGGRTNYRRYLTPLGGDLFDNWPEWTDATGGTGLADEPAETAPSQPERSSPDAGAAQPAT